MWMRHMIGAKALILVPKANGKVKLYLDLAILTKVLIRSVHRGLTLNDILPRLTGTKYLILINMSSGYHNLKVDEKSSYLTTFSCTFDRYWYIRLLFWDSISIRYVPKENTWIIQWYVKCIWYCWWHLIAWFDELAKDHDKTLEKVLQLYR